MANVAAHFAESEAQARNLFADRAANSASLGHSVLKSAVSIATGVFSRNAHSPPT